MNANEHFARKYYAAAAKLATKMRACHFGSPGYCALSEQRAELYKRGQEYERAPNGRTEAQRAASAWQMARAMIDARADAFRRAEDNGYRGQS